MPRKVTFISLIFGGVALLAGALFQALTWAFVPEPVQREPLASSLPAKLDGAPAVDEAIAATEEMKKAVGEMLNFNDGVYRVYMLPSARLSVYAAWWEAGRMSPRLIAGHTPDVCWPGSGWVRDKVAEAQIGSAANQWVDHGFLGGEWRVFTREGKPEYVIFWHKVGDDILAYGTGYLPPWWAVFDEIKRNGFRLRKEQLFVRISSDRPLQEIWGRSELAPLKEALLRLGLRREQSAP